jgi:hypothetical protein
MSAMHSSTWPYVDYCVGFFDHLSVVFNNDYGIANVTKLL